MYLHQLSSGAVTTLFRDHNVQHVPIVKMPTLAGHDQHQDYNVPFFKLQVEYRLSIPIINTSQKSDLVL